LPPEFSNCLVAPRERSTCVEQWSEDDGTLLSIEAFWSVFGNSFQFQTEYHRIIVVKNTCCASCLYGRNFPENFNSLKIQGNFPENFAKSSNFIFILFDKRLN